MCAFFGTENAGFLRDGVPANVFVDAVEESECAIFFRLTGDFLCLKFVLYTFLIIPSFSRETILFIVMDYNFML